MQSVVKPAKFGTARIITVGNELTTGLVADANARVIARFLLGRGYFVSRIVSVPDNEGGIIAEVREAARSSDLVVVTGGLGPTHDDVTKTALCGLFKCKTKFQPAVLRRVRAFFKKIGRKMPEANRSYADVPECAVALRNDFGLAPGLFFKGKVLALPGVPHEAERMLLTSAGRLIRPGGTHVRESTFHTAGADETRLTDEMKGLAMATKFADVAFLPKLGNVDVRLVARGSTQKKAGANMASAKGLLLKDIRKYVWGTDDQTIEGVVGGMLKRAGKSLCVAESCTGGGVGKRITSVPGSSEYFLGGATVYSNSAKTSQVGVPKKLLAKFGAVSGEAAAAMARGARKSFEADYAVSATGVAGPGGGTREKPVGLVFVAVADGRSETVRRLLIAGGRETVRERTTFEALFLLYEKLRRDAL